DCGGAHGDAIPAGDRPPGQRILVFDRWSTVVFAVVSIAAAVLPDPFELVAVPVSLALFLIGSGAFLWAYLVAISRSRFVEISVGGAFFLAGDVAPRDVARALRLLLGIQIVVAVAVAALRPFPALAPRLP